jgi:pimeloyl-ACP methyl ester carboxylesterase
MRAISSEDLARITVPVALVWGRHDLATPLAVAEAVSGRHKWPLQVIDNSADDPPVEQPEALVRALHVAWAAAGSSASRQ